MIKTKHQPHARSLSTDNLAGVRGGSRHAERSSADTAASACADQVFSWTVVGVTTTITVYCTGGVGVETTGGSTGGGGGPHVA